MSLLSDLAALLGVESPDAISLYWGNDDGSITVRSISDSRDETRLIPSQSVGEMAAVTDGHSIVVPGDTGELG